VAEADYDCRPPGVRPTASEPKQISFFAASAILLLLRTPQAQRLQPPDDAVLAFKVRAFSPDGDCATRSHRRRVPHERKKRAVRQIFTKCRFAPAAPELTWSNWIIWLTPEPFPKAVMGDERIRTLGDAWQHAIGNVIAGPACCPTG
jgi:hypothetical protein